MRGNNEGDKSLAQDMNRLDGPKEMGFGSWPAKGLRAVSNEKETERVKTKEVGLNGKNTGIWSVK